MKAERSSILDLGPIGLRPVTSLISLAFEGKGARNLPGSSSLSLLSDYRLKGFANMAHSPIRNATYCNSFRICQKVNGELISISSRQYQPGNEIARLKVKGPFLSGPLSQKLVARYSFQMGTLCCVNDHIRSTSEIWFFPGEYCCVMLLRL